MGKKGRVCIAATRWGRDLRSIHAAVGNGAAHAGDEADTPRLLKAHHLASGSLRRHEDARYIDAHHSVDLVRRVLERRHFVVDTGSGDEAVELAGLMGDCLHDFVELFYIPDVGLVVREARVQFAARALAYFRKARGWVVGGRG